MKFATIILALAFTCTQADEYDVIVVGAGAAGCPLAQTLAEGGLKTLLIERGSERPESSNNIAGWSKVLRSECVESFSSKGVVVSTGNCMGGATSVNQGIFIEETNGWFEENFNSDKFFDKGLIRDAYNWVRTRVAPKAAYQITPEGQLYAEETIKAMEKAGLELGTVENATVPEYGIWRPYTTFDNTDGTRFSADKLLDRSNTNLVIMTNKEVKKVIFKKKGNRNFASCVQFADATEKCIKDNGRIYLSGGAFHTPQLLMNSGIKEGGDIYDNPEVGKNLSDKPGTFALTFFKRSFGYAEITLAEVAANKIYKDRTLLFEDSSIGEDSGLDTILYEKTFVPRGLRDSPFANEFIFVSDCCTALQASLGGGEPLPQQCGPLFDNDFSPCAGLQQFSATTCLSKLSFLAAFVADPVSTGTVTLNQDGDPIVDVNYLADSEDLEAFGAAAKLAYIIKNGMDPDEDTFPEGTSDTCPNAYQQFIDSVLEQAGIEDNPLKGFVSVVQPNALEALALSSNVEIGSAIGNSAIISPHHFAGTARVGDVINEELKVKGVNGLYVADASALPKTPRVNTMATTMMIGRIAGVAYVNKRRGARALRGNHAADEGN
mmetsp:Transcript_17433/g.37653  ORF Transcript_17433/g.37653 Transcript_17433/m.37653 type:complete len:606 (+) Transcript_17433:110-1927(+)|eukprot:CAMPEP_0172298940 /NCGR_PEP_ID=MMETSP1058-20130122/1359_1 /TAXON_ID=83371 /ORGANISM="Detonula confervacea, Strain CCMP 353" /LENGTH=605 /DNA_ID=CAMNT_0013008235 /DNA_START=103 /DNA_END=1920 /DNA_ORIENTATION=-